MKTTSTFGKIFFGIVILLAVGFTWMMLKPSQDTGSVMDQASKSTTSMMNKIGDSASNLKDKTEAMAGKAAEKAGDAYRTAGDMAGKAADTAGDAVQATSDMAGKAADKAGDAARATSDMAGKAADKAGDAYRAASDMAGKAADKAGDAVQAGSDMANDAAERAGDTPQSAGEMTGKSSEMTGQVQQGASDMTDKAMDSASQTYPSTVEAYDKARESSMDGASAGKAVPAPIGQLVEIPAKYEAGDSSTASLTKIEIPQLTTAGTWVLKDIRFDHNQADLKPSTHASLNELTAILNAKPDLNIEIHGHTDSSGPRAYNQDLSQRRALSVKSYLESQGIDSSRMTIMGYGPDRPLSGTDSDQGSADNRRIEIKPLN